MRYEVRQHSDGEFRIHDTKWPKAPPIIFGRISARELAEMIADYMNTHLPKEALAQDG